MSDADTSDYDARVQAIRVYNQPILDDFEAWLEQSGLSEKTVQTHVENIDFFTNYLVYSERLKKLDEAKDGDVWMFLADWFPRKALWASVTGVKSYLASFKKFFRWMGETGRASFAAWAQPNPALLRVGVQAEGVYMADKGEAGDDPHTQWRELYGAEVISPAHQRESRRSGPKPGVAGWPVCDRSSKRSRTNCSAPSAWPANDHLI